MKFPGGVDVAPRENFGGNEEEIRVDDADHHDNYWYGYIPLLCYVIHLSSSLI